MVNNDSSADLEQQTIGVAVNDHIYSISAVTTSKKLRRAALGSGRAEGWAMATNTVGFALPRDLNPRLPTGKGINSAAAKENSSAVD
jgi:hypothetical protein